jgi:soluble lytic murein transglycosylase-like protein
VNVWRTDSSGIIYVTSAIGEPERMPTLAGKLATLFDSRVMRWAELAFTAGQPYEVATGDLLAMAFRESGGNANARNAEVPPGIGLTQITNTSLYQGLTQAQVLDPLTNLRIAAKFLHYLASHCPAAGLPELASMYNAGAVPGPGNTLRPHPSSLSPWGYRETAGHITAEVAARNYYLAKFRPVAGVADPLDDAAVLSEVARTMWDETGELLAENVHAPD